MGSPRSRPSVTVIKACLEVREPAALEPALFLTRTLPRLLPVRGLQFTARLDLSSILGVGLLPDLHLWVEMEESGMYNNTGSNFNPRAAIE